MKYLFIAYAAVMVLMSLIAFAAYGRDKGLAKKGAYRTSEKTLLLLAAFLGGTGAFAGMRTFRHKTKHLRFQLFVPLCMIVQLAGLAALAYFAIAA